MLGGCCAGNLCSRMGFLIFESVAKTKASNGTDREVFSREEAPASAADLFLRVQAAYLILEEH